MKNKVNRREFLSRSLLMSVAAVIPGFAGLQDALTVPRQGKPMRAAMMNNGLVVSWDAQGKLAAEQFGKWLGVEIVWFDGKLDLNVQRAAMEEIAQQQWDFVALQPGSIGTLVKPT